MITNELLTNLETQFYANWRIMKWSPAEEGASQRSYDLGR